MASGKYNFVIEQGATLDFEIAYTDSNSNKIDLTDHRGRMQIRDKFPGPGNINNSTLIITLSSSLETDGTGLNFSGSSGINPPTSGTIGVFIDASRTAAFDFSKAIYDLEIVSGSIVTRLLEGNVSLTKEVTIAP
tara:strand:+ start:97 stop:501 length:405 start_codon:yes stop_codon:yes gene_type:complete